MVELLNRTWRFISWHRRLIAALLVFTCVLAIAHIVAPAPTQGITVITTRKAIAPGAKITAEDIKFATLPSQALPADALTSFDSAIGKIAIIGALPGTTLTANSVLSTRSAPAGYMFVPIRLPDPAMLSYIRPGDRVSAVIIQPDGISKVIARSMRVAAIPAQDINSKLTTSNRDSGATAILEVPDAVAATVSSANAQRGLTITLG